MAVADYQAASEIIIERFKTQWDITHPEVSGARDVPVAWPNVQFDPSTQFDQSTQDGWVRLTILITDAFPASSSGAKVRQRTVGLVGVQVFTPLGTGDRVAAGIADDVVSALQFTTLDGVVIGAATPLPVGTTSEGNYQINVTARFRYDTLITFTSEATYGTWQNPMILGGASGLYVWYDFTNGCERNKSGSAPLSEIDGVESGVGGVV